jgi:hypothetical protein
MKIIAAAVIASLLFPTIAMADPYEYHRHEVYRSYDTYGQDRDREYRPRRERHRDAGDYVLPVIGGIILGAILTSPRNQNSRPVYQEPTYQSDEVYRQPPPRVYRYDRYCDCYR